MIYANLFNRGSIMGQMKPGLRTSLWTSIIGQTNRSGYHSISGVFGNYLRSSGDLEKRIPSVIDYPKASFQLVTEAFKVNGHRLCQLDPLSPKKQQQLSQQLDETFLYDASRLLNIDLVNFINADFVNGDVNKTEFLSSLFNQYCSDDIGYEFAHCSDPEEVQWFKRMLSEQTQTIDDEKRELIAKQLLQTEALDHFLAKKFQSVKRYGCEGAETMVTFVEEIMQLTATNLNRAEIVVGMPHRGRLNLLVNTLHYPPEALFRKLSGKSEFDLENGPGQTFGTCDVASHLYTSSTKFPNSQSANSDLRITLLPNPSHLELVSPVICGYSRGKLMNSLSGPYQSSDLSATGPLTVIPLQIHGDAAFSGQGIIMETLAMANVEHYTVNGSIHLIVNNQVGYTTPGRNRQARSSNHCSDPAKLVNAPVIHVNGYRPELVCRAAQLAFEYRQKFHKDVVVNLVCFRLHGHNELDDPTFTNPCLYKRIHSLPQSIPKSYAESVFSAEQSTETLSYYNDNLNNALTSVDKFTPPSLSNLITESEEWQSIEWPSNTSVSRWRTGVSGDTLRQIGSTMVTVSKPEWNLHSTLKRVFKDRLEKINSGSGIDWATAELLAFGSLLYQGYNVRISGQDVGRGTFSQRHAMVVDQSTDDVYIPLNDLKHRNEQSFECGKLEVCNSILSEEAVLAFEYGLSLTTPKLLPIWEAQFGDFFNGAQPVIDTLVSSGEAKWLLQSSLTLLLPHGYDGAGPEHTSARLERFLQQSNSSETEIDTDNVNWSVAFPTTAAQHFHLLRRQMIRPYRKPLVVMSPKMLLRDPRCVATMDQLVNDDAHFRPVLDDSSHVDVSPAKKTIDSVRSIIFCAGKHYYALEKERESMEPTRSKSIAIVRLEELCPFPVEDLAQILLRYPNANKLIWSQEEHRNMGAWSFVRPRFENILKKRLNYAGRGHLETPAVGVGQIHQSQVKQLIIDTFALCNSK